MHGLNPEQHAQRLAELDVDVELFERALDLAAADVRGCTDFDAPATRGFLFWSRVNRYIAEQLDPLGWKRTQRDSILRMIHPTGSHAITAISGDGGVGDLNKKVRSKNPKGGAVARLVERNRQLEIISRDELLFGRELDEIETWCLLYKREDGIIRAELSRPVEMHGKYIDEWRERLPLQVNLDDPGYDISLDDPGDGDDGPEVMVEFVGEN
ncbi:hypothetical protein ACFVHQ_22830 [Actinomycetes bacterium NPDC127524]